MPHAAALALLLPSCATILTPSEFDVPVDSVPPGATVRLDGATVGVTPCTIRLGRTQDPELVLELDGHHAQRVALGNEAPPTALLCVDLVLFPFVFVDLATNARWMVCDDPVVVHLTPAQGTPPPAWRREDYAVSAATARD